MATRYELLVRDHAGTIVARFPAWRRLEYTLRLNAVDGTVLVLDDTPPPLIATQSTVATLFCPTAEPVDRQIEVWRWDVAATPPIARYCDCYAFHRTQVRQADSNGLGIFTSYGAGLNDLLARRGIWQYAGSAEADKSGAGETVIKAYVDENAGPGATSPPRVGASGVTTGLTIEADAAAGATWEGSRAWKGLLETVQEIANATALDFGVVKSGDAAFEFQVRPIWGDDRSTTGLVPATGLNAAGNAPVIFALGFANMAIPTYSLNRTNEVNTVLVLGQGQESDRTVQQVTEAASITASPWNRREASRNANQESTTAGLTAVGESLLAELTPRESLTFQVLQTNACRYGREYFLGDLITARYGEIERTLQITEVRVVVEGLTEQIDVTVTDIHEDEG